MHVAMKDQLQTKAKSQQKGEKQQIKRVAPAREIRVDLQFIYDALQENLSGGATADLAEITKLAESITSYEFFDEARLVKQFFYYLSAGARKVVPDWQEELFKDPNQVSPGALDAAEEKFLDQLVRLLLLARYKPLSNSEWLSAQQEAFIFDIPVTVQWNSLDSGLLQKLWALSPEHQKLKEKFAPEVADRLLVFHRGVGVAKAKGLYFWEKVDLAVDYLVLGPARALYEAGLKATQQEAKVPFLPSSRRTSASASPSTYTWGSRTVERRTLRSQLPSIFDILANMFRVIELQEPTFQEVVVLYRRVHHSKAHTHGSSSNSSSMDSDSSSTTSTSTDNSASSASAGASRSPEYSFNIWSGASVAGGAIPSWLCERNVYLKSFENVPMADIELTFPDKKVFVKPLTLVQLVSGLLASLGASAALLTQSMEEHHPLSIGLLWSAISLVALKCFSTLTTLQVHQNDLTRVMTTLQYECARDSQEGVIATLLDGLADQQAKEVLLAYGLMAEHDADMSMAEVDSACERWLLDRFKLEVDFAIEDVLPRLVSWGLVRQGSKAGTYRAVPLAQARPLLVQVWQQCYSRQSARPTAAAAAQAAMAAAADVTCAPLASTDSPMANAVFEEMKTELAGVITAQLASGELPNGQDSGKAGMMDGEGNPVFNVASLRSRVEASRGGAAQCLPSKAGSAAQQRSSSSSGAARLGGAVKHLAVRGACSSMGRPTRAGLAPRAVLRSGAAAAGAAGVRAQQSLRLRIA